MMQIESGLKRYHLGDKLGVERDGQPEAGEELVFIRVYDVKMGDMESMAGQRPITFWLAKQGYAEPRFFVRWIGAMDACRPVIEEVVRQLLRAGVVVPEEWYVAGLEHMVWPSRWMDEVR